MRLDTSQVSLWYLSVNVNPYNGVYRFNRGLARVKQQLLGGHVSGQLSMAHIGSEHWEAGLVSK